MCILCVLFAARVTFAEFVQYVVDTWSAGKLLDQHWRPQHEICHPCKLNYDFIGRFENLKNDAQLVLANLTVSSEIAWNVTFPFLQSFRSRVPLVQQRSSIYASIPLDNVKKLIRVYQLDYKLFGYDYHWVLPE